MTHTLEQLKKLSKYYEELLLNKVALTNILEELVAKYDEMHDRNLGIAKLLCSSEELSDEEKASISDEDFINLKLIENLAKSLKSIETSVATIDRQAKENVAIAYFTNQAKFKVVSSQMKKIENLSAKYKKQNPSKAFDVRKKNAEGRYKNINQKFEVEYSKLVDIKIELAKKIAKYYRIERQAREKNQEVIYTKDNIYVKNNISEISPQPIFSQSKIEDKTIEKKRDDLLRAYNDDFNDYETAGILNNLNYNGPSEEEKEQKYQAENDALVAMVNKHHDEDGIDIYSHSEDYLKSQITNGQEKPLKIKKVKKPLNKTKLVNIFKKATAIITAGLIVTTSVANFISFHKKDKKNAQNLNNTSSIVDISTEYNDLKQSSNEIILNKDIKLNITNEDKKSSIKLGDKFTINNNANIYSSMYDAAINREPLSPYFSNETQRTVAGIALRYDGNLKLIHFEDKDANENINSLINEGAEVVAVLAICDDVSQNSFEGFYNINDVNILANTLGGISR